MAEKSELTIMPMLYSKQLEGDVSTKAIMVTPYAVPLIQAYLALDTGVLYKSRVHGQGHIERVMLLGAIIARNEKLSTHEERLLLLACAYHDIGRVDDSKDDAHGRRSAMMIKEKNLRDLTGDADDEELKAIQAAICTHSVHDDQLEANAKEFGVSEEYMPLCRKLCFCLKDADILDRVRLNDLDTKYLRHEKSVALKETAEYIFREYTRHAGEKTGA